jgi:cell division septation protein DedD
MQQERRLSERKTLEQLAHIELPFGNDGIVRDVSEGGLSFDAGSPVELCGPIAFWFSAHSNRIEGTGELVWTDQAKRTVGLRFTQLSEGVREKIKSWPNESNRRLGSRSDSAVRPQSFEKLREVPARDEVSSSVRRQASTDSAPSDASLDPEVLRTNIYSHALRPKKFPSEDLTRNQALGIAVLAIIIVVLAYIYREATQAQYTYQAPSPESNLSSQAAQVGDAFAEKLKTDGAPTQAAQQSSSRASPGTARANAARPPVREAPAAAAGLRKPPLRRGAFIVQVVAFRHEVSARKVAESLRQKNFPAFINATLTNGVFYRVLVGPYGDEESARIAQSELGRAGFKPFIRH